MSLTFHSFAGMYTLHAIVSAQHGCVFLLSVSSLKAALSLSIFLHIKNAPNCTQSNSSFYCADGLSAAALRAGPRPQDAHARGNRPLGQAAHHRPDAGVHSHNPRRKDGSVTGEPFSSCCVKDKSEAEILRGTWILGCLAALPLSPRNTCGNDAFNPTCLFVCVLRALQTVLLSHKMCPPFLNPNSGQVPAGAAAACRACCP